MLDLVESVECCNTVSFCVRRIIKHLNDEIVDPSVETHCHLADVDHFGRSPADDMNAQNLQCFCMEQNLKHSRVVPDDLVACDLLVIGASHLVAEPQFFKFVFSITAGRNFWKRI